MLTTMGSKEKLTFQPLTLRQGEQKRLGLKPETSASLASRGGWQTSMNALLIPFIIYLCTSDKQHVIHEKLIVVKIKAMASQSRIGHPRRCALNFTINLSEGGKEEKDFLKGLVSLT